MSIIKFYEEARRLEVRPEHLVIDRILKADSFDIALFVLDSLAEVRLHECENDKLFYVIRGEMEIEVEGKLIPLKEGEGILVKAGEKHKQRTSNRVWIIVIAQQPHQHKFYEEIHGIERE